MDGYVSGVVPNVGWGESGRVIIAGSLRKLQAMIASMCRQLPSK